MDIEKGGSPVRLDGTGMRDAPRRARPLILAMPCLTEPGHTLPYLAVPDLAMFKHEQRSL